MYDAKNSREEAGLPPDVIFDGVIINLEDGKVRDFIKDTAKWAGDVDSACIEISVEVLHNERKYTFGQMFTYTTDEGQVVYSPRSNLGKYFKKYGKLPEVGDKVKALANAEGFLRLKMD